MQPMTFVFFRAVGRTTEGRNALYSPGNRDSVLGNGSIEDDKRGQAPLGVFHFGRLYAWISARMPRTVLVRCHPG